MDRMLGSMTSKQLTEWMAFFKIENDRIESKSSGGKHQKAEPTAQELDEQIKAVMGGIGKANAQKHSQS